MAQQFQGRLRTALLIGVLCVAGCQNAADLNKPSQDFVSAANALVQAESDYFDEIQAASDAAYRLQATETYVAHAGTFKAFADELSRRDDFSKAKKLRVAAMAQLQNYAQQVAAISSGAGATWLPDQVKSTTAEVNTLVSDAGAKATSQLLTANAGIIQSAVVDLGQAIISDASAHELRSLAVKARDPLAKIAEMVKQDAANIEADNFTASLKADQTQAIRDVLHFIYDDPKVNAYERFTALQMTADWKPSLVTKGQAIQSALKKLLAANDALSSGDAFSAGDLAQQAYDYAQQALGVSAR